MLSTAPERSDGESDELPPAAATGITAVVLLGYFVVAATCIFEEHPPFQRCSTALALMVGVFLCQLAASFPRLRPPVPHAGLWLLGLETLLTYLPFHAYRQAWLSTPGFLAGTALLVLPSVTGWPAFVTVVFSSDVMAYWLGVHNWAEAAYTTAATAVTGLVVFGLSRLTALVAEVHRSRAELTRIAVEHERQRFARDLHDTLGYSLSTITLKCSLVRRYLPPESSRAGHELTEVLQITRQALADVRAVSHGYREMSLAAESHAVEAMLTAVGVSIHTRVDCPGLSGEADTVLATVLREGITNMLRHSRVSRCTVEAVLEGGQARLTVTNDGAWRPTGGCRRSGTGLGNLRTRVEHLGGRLTAAVQPNGSFELTAVIDLASAPSA